MKLLLLFVVQSLLLSESFALKCKVLSHNYTKSTLCAERFTKCCTMKVHMPGNKTTLSMSCCKDGECKEGETYFKQLGIQSKCVECDKDDCNPDDPDKGVTIKILPIASIFLSSIICRMVL